jgi:hypothetical protein
MCFLHNYINYLTKIWKVGKSIHRKKTISALILGRRRKGMSSANEAGTSGPGPSLEQLAKETAELRSLWQRTLEANKARNRVRMIISLGILAVFIIYGLMFYKLGINYDDKKLLSLIEQKSSKWFPYFSAILKDELQRTGEAYLKELDKQAPKIAEDVVKKLVAEAEKLSESLVNIPQNTLKEQTRKIVENQKQMIQRDFPEFKDPKKLEALMFNLNEGVSMVAWNTLSSKLEPHVKALNDIKTSLKGIQAAPKAGKVSPSPEADELLYTTFELLKYKLAKETGAAKEPKKAK